MKIQIELTEAILSVLTPAQQTEILRGLITSIKTDVDDRIAKITAELGDTTVQLIGDNALQVSKLSQKKPEIEKKPEFNHLNQTIPNSVIAEIQKRYDNGNRSLMMLLKEDYPDIKYRTVYGHIVLKKKLKK
jgi:hypothetical protein